MIQIKIQGGLVQRLTVVLFIQNSTQLDIYERSVQQVGGS